MPDIRVMVVDDAVVVRHHLKAILDQEPGITVVATALNGRMALDKIALAQPDIVILDVEMPVMSGLETLTEIRKLKQYLPVIMFSSYTERGASITLEALGKGADDYAAKPVSSDPAGMSEQVRRALIPKIRLFAYRSKRKSSVGKSAVLADSRRGQRIDVLTIAASTGGPNALSALLEALDFDLPTPVLMVQHMPPVFTRLFADRLNEKTRHQVSEGANGAQVLPGQIWVAPGDHHMEVTNSGGEYKLRTHQGKLENSCRPAADPLFRSVARVYGRHSLAVVLTGMGHDGLDGCRSIAAAAGQILVQDKASSVVWSMPGSVAGEGLAEGVLTLPELAAEIQVRLSFGR